MAGGPLVQLITDPDVTFMNIEHGRLIYVDVHHWFDITQGE